MSDIAIKIENLGKQYRLGNVGTGTLSHDLKRWWAVSRGKEDPTLQIGMENKLAEAGGEYIYALKNINLEVKQGDILGIIGKNGAGKSTLLKILSRVTTPTTGTIDMYGRVASLLEVGTGFHPELTGRENIFLNGAIMGMTKEEIKSKFDEIVDFAGVSKYIDTPVKRYSSGMYVRLAFAVAAYLEPEILIVDEVLAVGDADFQKKAIGKMQDVSKNEGRTVLFVSHNIGAVKTLCNKGILLEKGGIVFSAGSEETAMEYSKRSMNTTILKEKLISECKRIELETPFLTNLKNEITSNYFFGEKLILNFKFNFFKNITKINPGFAVLDSSGQRIFTSHLLDDKDFSVNGYFGEKLISTIIDLPCLAPGYYKIIYGVRDENEKTVIYCENNVYFEVDQINSKNGSSGILWYTSKWQIS